MKISAASLLLMFLLWAVFASATGPQGTIQHVIIVIQENRTPTNLFYDDQTLVNNGAHVRGPNNSGKGPCQMQPSSPVLLTGVPLAQFCWDPDHSHFGPYLSWPHPHSWVNEYDNGAMDGACTNYVKCTACGGSCPNPPQYLQYTYASNSDGSMTPLFTVAEHYGFANYMFQTNQGPSFPAHQFLFSGTSAPESDPNDLAPHYHDWFVAENPERFGIGGSTGCTAFANAYALQIQPLPSVDPVEQYGFAGDTTTGALPNAGYPCYDHNSLPTLLDGAGISWRYYYPNTNLWNAPLTNYQICLPTSYGGGMCNNTSDYQKNVAPYTGALGPAWY